MSKCQKGAISPFVQSGNHEISSLTGFEPWTLRVAVGPLIHYIKFPYENFLRDIDNFSVAESPVESNNNRRFLVKSRNLFHQLYDKIYYLSDKNYYQIVVANWF